MKLVSYPEYKDSGVPWLGDIPVHWTSRKLRNMLTPVSVRNRPDLPLLSVVREKGVIKRNVISKEENHNFIPDDLSNYKVVKKSQFAMNKMKAWQGSYGISDQDGIVSPAYFVFDLDGVGEKFFHVAVRSKAYVPFFAQASDGVRVGQWDLNQSRMKQVPFFVPPAEEQTKIARFLDWKTAQIKKIIRNKRRLIELLNEQKQNVINQAVTRGLDPSVKLKPSGVEWIGDIPEHWEVRRLKYLLREVDERSAVGEEQHLSMSQKHGGLVRSSEIEERRLMSDSYAGGKLCKLGDVVLNRLKAHLGVFACAPIDGVISPDYSVYRSIGTIEPFYYEYLLRSTSIRPELRIRCKGIVEGFWRLYSDDFLSLNVPVPTRGEQSKIIEGIKIRSQTIDQAITRAEREIELMREYRTRLISDVVTGKVDVRGIEVPEVAEDELVALDEETDEPDDVINDEGDLDEAD